MYKKKWVEDSLVNGLSGTAKDQWKPIKQLRKGYAPRHVRLKWKGKTQPIHRRAEVLAEQLAEVQWSNTTTQSQKDFLNEKQDINPPSPDMPTTPFTYQEFKHALAQLKKGKAPGPDEIEMGFPKLLPLQRCRLSQTYSTNGIHSAAYLWSLHTPT